MLEAEVGWEAAVFDHYRALVQTICQRLAPNIADAAHAGAAPAVKASRIGGSTFTLDVWEGHPFADEAYSVLARFRATHTELYERIERYNADHRPPAEHDQVVIYAGQHVQSRRSAEATEIENPFEAEVKP